MDEKIFKRRVLICCALLFIVLFTYAIRLTTLHFSGDYAIQQKDSGAKRGMIKDRNGFILAMSIEFSSLFANPEEIDDPKKTAEILAPVVRESAYELLKKLSKKKRFIWIKRKMDDETAHAVQKLGLRGLYLKKEFKRVYPHDTLASNITGFVGVDNTGLEGMEFLHDGILSGRDEEETFPGSPRYGKNITLTIDRFIQNLAEQEMEDAVKRYRAKQGIMVAMEVGTGRILALGKYPGYNPNFYYSSPAHARKNFGVVDAFEPGSTMKVMTLASLLENKPAVMKMKFTCIGSVEVADTKISCTSEHGSVDIPDIIRHSCNAGIIKAVKNITKSDLYNTLKEFGFGEKTGIELPGESEGIVRPTGKWSGLSKYSISFGHEISVTSLQMAAAFSAVANGGVYVYPSLIESIEWHGGEKIKNFSPKKKGMVVKRDIAQKMMQMMRGVVESGTGYLAEPKHYRAAGKTGTSQKYMRSDGVYSDRVISSFIGIAPYEKPRLCVFIAIDDTEGKLSGGQVAAPVFARFMDRALPYLGEKGSVQKKSDPLKSRKAYPDFDGKTMPDFRGLGTGDTLRLLADIRKKYDVKYTLAGKGRAYHQRPASGHVLGENMEIIIYLSEGQ